MHFIFVNYTSIFKLWLIYKGVPPKMEFICKKCVFTLTCLNFSHLQTTLHLMQYTYQDVFPLLRMVFELVDFDAF